MSETKKKGTPRMRSGSGRGKATAPVSDGIVVKANAICPVGGKPELTTEQKEALGFLAKKTARQTIIDTCASEGLTIAKVAKTVVAALDAKVVRAQLDIKGEIGWVYSKPLTDHVTQLKAVEQATVLLDLKPSEKHEVDVMGSMSDAEIDRRLASLTQV